MMSRLTQFTMHALQAAGLVAAACLALPLQHAYGDTPSRTDVLRLSSAALEGDELTVFVEVLNVEPLIALDIPLRFGEVGDQIDLDRVIFTERVKDWEFKHAAIDNVHKTVILGLISEMTATRADAALDMTSDSLSCVAQLVFSVNRSRPAVVLQAFETQRPNHSLMYISNESRNGRPTIAVSSPAMEVNASTAKAGTLPTEYQVSEGYPNPFNGQISFTLRTPRDSDYEIKIYNIVGRLVRRISGHLQAGEYRITWDARTDRGESLSSGVYFADVRIDTFATVRRFTLVK